MRGAFTVTWLAASALAGGCATQTQAQSLSRVSMLPIALTQESVSPYRWIVCDVEKNCHRPTVKTVVAAVSLHSPLAQQSGLQVMPRPLLLADDATEIKAVVSPGPVSEANTNTLDVNFAVNSSFLDVTARAVLDELRMTGKDTLHVRGYTDSTGSTEYNAWLAARRAQAVKEYVIRTGVEPGQIRMEVMGECCFVASNGTPEGRSANRRVEVVINGR